MSSSGGTPADALVGLPDRYRDLGHIGTGGMGEVRRVLDTVLGRTVALKLVRADRASDDVLSRFREEARTTAQLDHPGIVPVHDVGRLPDGRLWFTMREVRGETLATLLGARRLGLHRLLDAFAQTCRAVAHAHQRGVVHRDLKPANVMVGEFGEVQVMDWGLGKRVDDPGPEPEPEGEGAGGEPGETLFGEALGTPAYMAPEQARGQLELIGPATDVYALGAMLYEILTGRPPHEGDTLVPTIVKAYVAEPVPVARWAEAQQASVPAELARLCERAMRTWPQDRPTAGELVAEVSRWLDGETRREEALELVRSARELDARARSWREAERDHLQRARSLLAALPPFTPPAAKVAAWAEEDEARVARERADLLEVECEHGLHAALARCPDLAEARVALAWHHRGRLLEAERRRDAREVVRERALLLQHDDGRHRAWLEQPVEVVLRTDPEGAEAVARPYLSDGRRLEPGPPRPLGRTPLRTSLPPGSWLVELSHPARRTVLLPLLVDRGGECPTSPPGAPEVPPIPLPEGLSDDERYVPPGWFVYGGDDLAVDAAPRTSLWVDGFVARRYPVTNGEYLTFLDDLEARGEGALAERCAPSRPGPGGAAARVEWRRDGRRWVLPTEGAAYRPDVPVTQVDLPSVLAYAAWRSGREGVAWRLPGEVEWEKMARGADGRWWPWGDHHEPAWSRMIASVPVPGPAAVREHPEDESPYGIRGLAGNVRDWTSSPWTTDGLGTEDASSGELQVVRGGAWGSTEPLCRPAARFANRPSDRFFNCGFRLVRSL